MVLHTAGELPNWHPHIHAIAMNGVVADHGAFLALQDVDSESMIICFRDKVFKALLDEELIDQETVENMKSREYSHLRQGFGGQAGFQVYAREAMAGDDENALLFLGRYLKKSPVSLERIHLKDTIQSCRLFTLRNVMKATNGIGPSISYWKDSAYEEYGCCWKASVPTGEQCLFSGRGLEPLSDPCSSWHGAGC